MRFPGKVWTLLLGISLVMPLAASGANALSELRGLRTRESRIPVYNKDRLQLLLYSEECFQKGRLLETTSPVLDIIRPDADIDTIDTGKNTKIYPLGSSFTDVLKFWSGHRFSDGVVVTGKADIDQESKIAAGGGQVFFRSPLLDLNGIGFDADYGKKTIFVRKDVQIVLRTAASDPLKSIKTGKVPEKYEFLKGTSDTLLIDMAKRVITLTGNVRVQEDRGVIHCDRMMIVLPPEKDRKKTDKSDSLSIRGVSKVICDGRVQVKRTGGTEVQQAFGERMVYDLESGLLRLTGTLASMPMLQQGQNTLQGRRIDIYRNDERMQVLQDCQLVYHQKNDGGKPAPVRAFSDRMDFDNRNNLGVLTGNVRVEEPRFALQCARMDIRLAETGTPDKKQQAAVSEITGMPEFAPGGKKELKDMICYGNVRMIHMGTQENAVVRKAAQTLPQTEVLADRADLGYNSNLLVFTGNVRIRDVRMKLDCDKMDIYLKDAAPAATKTAKAGTADKGTDARKVLEKIVCTGNVRSQESRMKMDCQTLTLFFRQVTDPARKAAPGMFQSQGTELVAIHTDGGVTMESIPEKKTASAGKTDKNTAAGMPTFSGTNPIRMTADHGRVDLVKNISEFHGGVKVREEQGRLDCEDLYLYGKEVASVKTAGVPEKTTAGIDSLDDDPFAGIDSKQVPQVIGLGDGRALDRVVALKDVVLVRKLASGGKQRATGQKAEYFVSRRLVELTGDAPDYAQVSDANPQNNGRSRKITVFLDRESVAFDGRVQMEFDAKSGKSGVDL